MKTEKVTYYEADYNDLDSAVKEIYQTNYNWNFVVEQDASNYSSYSFNVTGKLSSYDEEELITFKENASRLSIAAHILLNDMCRQGLIPAGKYLINVLW